MPSEQSLILKMLEEGKLTAEQAVELLTVLNRTNPLQTKEPPQPTPETAAEQLSLRERERRARHRLQSEERQLRRLMREEERKARRQAKEAATMRSPGGTHPSGKPNGLEQTIKRSLQMLGIPLETGPGFAFQRAYSGRFGRNHPQVNIQNTNGHVRIVASDDDQWRLELKVRAKAADASAARAVAENLVGVSYGETVLSIESKRLFGQNTTADIQLSLPRGSGVQLSVSCTNGTISVAELTGGEVVLRTVNGKIVGESLTGKTIEAHSVNGSIALRGASARWSCRASNGRINLVQEQATNAEIDLQTVNGPVQVTLPGGENLGYEVEAQNTTGGIKLSLPNMELVENRSRPGRSRVVARSCELSRKSARQQVKVRTVSGSIGINSVGEVE